MAAEQKTAELKENQPLVPGPGQGSGPAIRPKEKDPNVLVLEQIWPAVRGSLELYISPGSLAAWGVDITSLDLITGRPLDEDPKFVELLSPDRIQEVLNVNEPWEWEDWFPYMTTDGHDGHWQARDLWVYFSQLLRYAKDDDDEGRPLEEESDMMMRPGRPVDCVTIEGSRSDTCWQVDVIIEKLDRSVPHRTCLLVDDAPIIPGILATSEMHTIMATIGGRSRWEGYRQPVTTPVTILTTSGTKMRVTQGWVCEKTTRLRLRMSDIVDFKDGPENMIPERNAVLGWVLGTPVGQIRYLG